MNINILDGFEKICREKREHKAVIHNDEWISFGELYTRSLFWANKIDSAIGETINTPIAILLSKGIDSVIMDAAVMMSGNPFMNLDINTPIDRILNILKNVHPCLLITTSEYKAQLEDTAKFLLIDETTYDNTDDDCDRRKWKNIIDTDPFCIINTSGSTGTPKSVILNHKSFLDFLAWSADEFDFNGTEIVGSLSPVVFDIFVFEVCLLLTKGSCIDLIDSGFASFPVRLVEKLMADRISFIFWVPTIMVNIANMNLIAGRIPESLRLVWFAGEVFPTKQFLYWYDNLPEVTFVNMYGPIEITLDCVFHRITSRPDEAKPLPIGLPCRNTDIIVLNKKNERCREGEEGELCVRGTSLAMGYYNNPKKTEEAFIQNPLQKSYPELIYRTGDIVFWGKDGLLYIKGRKDSMIKHNGYRIELAEIEHVLVNKLKLVGNCCAIYDKERGKIVLFYESEKQYQKAEFRKELSTVLPKYMIPSEYCRMNMLPRNPNGKIDRLLLQRNSMNLKADLNKV